MNKPKVTVACITYNHGKYIIECLEGIFMQKCDFEYEVIIHDDCSTDNTTEILKEYQEKFPNKVKLILQTENQYSRGRKPLIDFVLPLAQGEYIAFCEGDDYWIDAFKLQKQIDLLDSNPKLAFCSHNVDKVDARGSILGRTVSSEKIVYYDPVASLHRRFPPLSLIFRNVKLEYTEGLKKAFNGDAVLTALLSQHGGAAHFGFVGARYRVHSGGVFSSQSYHDNEVRSIMSRRIMIKSSVFTSKTKTELRKNIVKRKINLFKFNLKRGRVLKGVSMLFV